MWNLRLLLQLLAVLVISSCEAKKSSNSLWTQARRMANLGGMFGSARHTAQTPYQLVQNHPVFQVTTAWGAPYMTYEKMDATEVAEEKDGGSNNILGFGGDMRPRTLFYMDPEDALAMHQEMKQMDNMVKSDIRITATSLSKAIRQSANFGDGLPTGTPIGTKDGKLPPISDGGSLRYKIVPSRRQLYYAARCQGRESVGLYGESDTEDASLVLEGSQAVDAANQGRRRNVLNGRSKAVSKIQKKFGHMEGYTGIPVFYCAAMKRQLPLMKGLLGGSRMENPVFFSYEDLLGAWKKMKSGNAPALPPNVQVFNMMDVLTSMDREQQKEKAGFMKRVSENIKDRLSQEPNLDALSFVPAGAAVRYKEELASRGNGKARLRPMR